MFGFDRFSLVIVFNNTDRMRFHEAITMRRLFVYSNFIAVGASLSQQLFTYRIFDRAMWVATQKISISIRKTMEV